MNKTQNSPADEIVHITAGDAHNLVVMASGRMYTFGYNNMGQCGHGHTRQAHVARPVEQVLEEADVYECSSETPKWIYAAGGRDHSLAVCESGHVYATGNNSKGTLGLPGLTHAIWFSKVHTVQSGNCEKVFAGVDHSFVLLKEQRPKRDELQDEEAEADDLFCDLAGVDDDYSEPENNSMVVI